MFWLEKKYAFLQNRHQDIRKQLKRMDKEMDSQFKRHPFKRYTLGHLMYHPGKILDDQQFHRHAERQIENVRRCRFFFF